MPGPARLSGKPSDPDGSEWTAGPGTAGGPAAAGEYEHDGPLLYCTSSS